MINLLYEDGEFVVWHDTDVQPQDGLCIGSGKTAQKALANAIKTLHESISECEQAMTLKDHCEAITQTNKI